MSLTTLTALKVHLGIPTADTSEDTLLTQLIRGCSGAIREYAKATEFGGLITSNSEADPTVITAPGHGLQDGQSIVISRSNSTPTIDGTRVVTVIDDDTFTVPVTVTVAGTTGFWHRKVTEYYSGDGTRWLRLKRKPVHSIVELYVDSTGYWGQGDDPFPADTLLDTSEYALKLDDADQTEKSPSALVLRVGSVWPRTAGRQAGILSPVPGPDTGNIKAVYLCGWAPLKPQHQLAMHQYCAQVRRIRTTGGDVISEQYDYYQYTLSPAADRENVFGSIRSLLGNARGWVW
jgi:hypothetical protein